MIIANNIFSFKIFSKLRFFFFVKSFNPNNSIANFLADVFENLFGNFNTNVFFNLAVDFTPLFAAPFFANLLTFGWFGHSYFGFDWFLQNDFLVLVVIAFFVFG